MLKPLKGLAAFFESRRDPTLKFRLGLSIKMSSPNAKIMEVVQSTLFFQFDYIDIRSFEFGASVKCLIRALSPPPKFDLALSFTLMTGMMKFEGSMETCWTKALGIKGLEICDLFLKIGISPAFPAKPPPPL